MQAVAKLSKNLTRPLFFLAPRTLTTLTAPSSLSNLLSSPGCDTSITHCTNTCLTGRTLLQSPWSAIQHRGAVVLGSDVSFSVSFRFPTERRRFELQLLFTVMNHDPAIVQVRAGNVIERKGGLAVWLCNQFYTESRWVLFEY